MTLEDIKDVVEEVCGLEIVVKSRKQEYVHARYIFMMLSLEFTSETYESIGGLVKRDHSLVNHCKNNFENNVLNVDRYFRWYRDCKATIKNNQKPKRSISGDVLVKMKMENDALKMKMDSLRQPLDEATERLFSLFNSLPDRLREDVMFKVETAYKINEKHKRDLTVIYTEA